VCGDAYSGQTFRQDFQAHGIQYDLRSTPASELYEALEPALNAGEVELLDHPTLTEQLVCLVWRGSKITHENNSHDDHANAAALAINLVRAKTTQGVCVVPSDLSRSALAYNGGGHWAGRFNENGALTGPRDFSNHGGY
jgi:hypothetical protein